MLVETVGVTIRNTGGGSLVQKLAHDRARSLPNNSAGDVPAPSRADPALAAAVDDHGVRVFPQTRW